MYENIVQKDMNKFHVEEKVTQYILYLRCIFLLTRVPFSDSVILGTNHYNLSSTTYMYFSRIK